MSSLSSVSEAATVIAKEPAAQHAAPIPGPLRGTVTLVLQTAFAQRLVIGRLANLDRNGVLGLFSFAELLRTIWHAAAGSDPYAEWWLLKVERALAVAADELEPLQAKALGLLSENEALLVAPASSVRPVVTDLEFSTPQAYRGAQLIGRYDAIARAVLTARHVGCVPADVATRMLWRAGQVIRSAFGSARGYVPTGVTRADLIHGTPRATVVVEKMGALPSVVLNETAVADHLPKRQRFIAGEYSVTDAATALSDAPPIVASDAIGRGAMTSMFEDDLIELFESP